MYCLAVNALSSNFRLVFESLAEYLAWFQNLVPPALRFIGEAPITIAAEVAEQ